MGAFKMSLMSLIGIIVIHYPPLKKIMICEKIKKSSLWMIFKSVPEQSLLTMKSYTETSL